MKPSHPIQQPWLSLVREVWIAWSLYNLIPGLLNLPGNYHQLIVLDPLPNNQGWGQATLSAAVARTGLDPQLVAWIILVPILIKILGFLSVGLLIFWRKSNEWIGLLTSFVLVGLCGTFTGGHSQSVILAALPPLWRVVAIELGALGWLAFYMFLILFPDGRFRPAWMRWVALDLGVWFILLEATNLILGQTPDWVIWGGFPVLGFTLFGQVYRYRHLSNPIERQQFRWFLFAIMTFIGYALLDYILVRVSPLPSQPGLLELGLYLARNYLGSLFFLMIPLSIGIAIFRYHLWDIDVIIRRTLIFGILTLALTLVYFGSVVLLQQMFLALTGQTSPATIVISTLGIAALFTPLRRRIQTTIDRRFFRSQYNAEHALAQFNQTLRDRIDLPSIESDLVKVVVETVQPVQATLWIRPTVKK
jgi:hypothetical protein